MTLAATWLFGNPDHGRLELSGKPVFPRPVPASLARRPEFFRVVAVRLPETGFSRKGASQVSTFSIALWRGNRGSPTPDMPASPHGSLEPLQTIWSRGVEDLPRPRVCSSVHTVDSGQVPLRSSLRIIMELRKREQGHDRWQRKRS